MRALTQARTRTRASGRKEDPMSLNYRERRRLDRIETRLLRSDPKLAALATMFAKLSPGERLPTWEQLATRPDRIRQAAALIVTQIAIMIAAVRLLAGAFRALLIAIVMGSRARPSQPARQETGPAGASS
jgi:hypothetical protein